MLKHSYQDDQCKKIANCGGINKNQGQRILNLCIVYILICIFNVLIFVCLSVCSNFLGGPRYNRGNVLYNSVEQWVVLSSSVKQRECFYSSVEQRECFFSSVEQRECSLQLCRTAGMFFIARQNRGNVLYSSVEPRECSLQLGRTVGCSFQLGRTAGVFFLARQNSGNVFYSSVEPRKCSLQLGRTARMFFIARFKNCKFSELTFIEKVYFKKKEG